MIQTLDDSLGRAACAWVEGVQRRPALVVAAIGAVTAALLTIALTSLGLHTNENDLFSDELRFFALREDFYASFPNLADPVVVVIDGDTADLAHSATERMAHSLRRDLERFAAVYQPDSGEFFERNGLLYLELHELDDLLDNLFAVQPQLSALSRDMSLHGFLTMLGDAASAQARGELEGFDLTDVFERVDGVIAGNLDDRPHSLSWADVITGRTSTRRDRRRFLLVQPMVDFGDLGPAETTLLGLRAIAADLGLNGDSGVRVRATGVLPLSYEEMQNVGAQSVWAGVASFIVVGLILMTGLGSGRLVLASLATLIVGLVWTTGFAALTVGRLNLISAAFAVLFIGLSVDFAIHLCVRLREGLSAGDDVATALPAAARSVGGSLVLCATTTAIGFFAFAPTEYKGVAELGIIAGSGMFISLFTNLTLLPALIAWKVPAASVAPMRSNSPRVEALLALPVTRAWTVTAATALLLLVSLTLLPRVHFDPNPLRMRDPSTDSVQVMNEMLADGDGFPWNLNVLTPNLASARALAERIEALPQVDRAVTLASFVPTEQSEKLAALEDAAFVLLPTLHEAPNSGPEYGRADQLAALEELEASLDAMLRGELAPDFSTAAMRLRTSVHRLRERETHTGDERGLADLENALIGSLPDRLRLLRASLTSPGVALEDLPPDLTGLMVGADGRARIEIFPAGDLSDRRQLEDYVAAVQEIAPDTFGEGLVILETGRAVVRSLRQALFTAASLIALLLLVLWRNVADAALVAAPIALAAIFTAACTVLLGVPFNFANVIVIPLLLGMGVDSGIHLIHRARAGELAGGNLLKSSTARAVMLSALTTIASFGTLSFSPHLGIASLGRLLTSGIVMILLCSLFVLPALAYLTKPTGNMQAKRTRA